MENLKRWDEMHADVGEIIACGERWKAIAATIGCTVQGYNDDHSASFYTPDGTVINVGPKFRAFLSRRSPTTGETT